MAIQQALASLQIEDGRSEITSFELPFAFDDAVTTLANLFTWVQNLGVAVDLITDGAIRKLRISILIPLPSGIKGTPVSGSDNEKTGLMSMLTVGVPSVYGVDVPAFPNSKLTGNLINTSDTAVAAFLAFLGTTTTGITPTDRGYHQLEDIAKHAFLTFRKHRRALRRA